METSYYAQYADSRLNTDLHKATRLDCGHVDTWTMDPGRTRVWVEMALAAVTVTLPRPSKCLSRMGLFTPLLTLRLFSRMVYSRIKFSSVPVVALAYVVL